MNKENQPEKGKLLVSIPFIPDPHFKKTVIYLTEHNEAGTLGFILNKQTELFLSDVVNELEGFNPPLFYGGPVQTNTLHFIHKSDIQLEGSVDLGNGIFWSGDFEALLEHAKNHAIKSDDFKFFIGYSGWALGQLDHELEEKTWVVASSTPAFVFASDPTKLWNNVLKSLGKQYAQMSSYPEELSWN